jgi:putative alpha-1,2-mannosidase
MTLVLENGNEISINAPNNNTNNRYVNSLNVNGKTYSKNWLSHKELMQGAVLDFDMTDTPNKNRGTQMADFPYSLSNEE